MTDTYNPYAPPKASVEPESPLAENCWHDGKKLILRLGSALPPRCVKCNEPARTPIKARKVHWHHPGWYVLALVSIPIYFIVALSIRKKAVVAAGLCAGHQRKRNIFLSVGWGGALLGIGVMFIPLGEGARSLILGLSMLFIAILAGMIGSRIVYPVRITKEEAHLKGCNAAFLHSLPQKYF